MNGTARFADKYWKSQVLLRCTIRRHAVICAAGDDDKRDNGFRNCGWRHIAGLLPADDAFAEPPRKPDRAARRLLARLRRFFDSAGNPSDSTAGDCEAGTDGG
jgi:hypothetical protein